MRFVAQRMEHESALREALSEEGDIELRFQGGESITVHSLKLKLASSVLKDLLYAVLDDEIHSAAVVRRRDGAEGQSMPSFQVCGRYRYRYVESRVGHSCTGDGWVQQQTINAWACHLYVHGIPAWTRRCTAYHV